jgi:AcrR family transcriptional regulator
VVYHRTEVSDKKREKRHAKIVSVAQKLFASKGVAGTTVQDIVSAAGTSIGNFYFYFQNKEELINEIIGGVLLEAYARAESLILQAPVGPTRLAIINLCNSNVLVGLNSKVLPILQQTGASVVAEYIVARNAAFLEPHMRANLPGRPDDEYMLIADAWTGSGRGVLGNVVARPAMTAVEIEEAIEFVVRYNLRAVGVSATDVEGALTTAREIVGSPEE